VRLFVAFDLPESVRREVSTVIDTARQEFPRARWVRPEAIHITLRFLGETSSSRLPDLNESLRAAFAPWAPVPMRVAGAGAFPSARRGRVLWLAIEAPEELARIESDVELAVTETLELEPERRPFSAHLTLARANPPWPRSATEGFIRRFGDFAAAPFEVHEGLLYESQLSPQGARYRVVEGYPLEGAR
jgi:2'-5' RNA ligase